MSSKKPYFQIIDGVQRCPNMNPSVFRESLSFRTQDGDVVLSAYPMCGSKWLLYIAQLIMKQGERITSHDEFNKCVRSIDHTNPQAWQSQLPVRLFLTRMPLRQEAMNPKAKYICMARNPWDVCVSWFHRVADLSVYRFQDGSFDDFFDSFLDDSFGLRSYFDVVAAGYSLRNEPNVFFVTYEHLMKDTEEVVLSLANFLGEAYSTHLKKNPEFLEKILLWSTPEHMKDIMVVTMRQTKEGSPVNSKMGHNGDHGKYSIVRNARMGQWRAFFTPEKRRRLEERIQLEGDGATFLDLWKEIRTEMPTAASQCAE